MRINTLVVSSLAAIALTATPTFAQNNNKRLYIEAADGFEVFVAAAMVKKGVAMDVVTDIESPTT